MRGQMPPFDASPAPIGVSTPWVAFPFTGGNWKNQIGSTCRYRLWQGRVYLDGIAEVVTSSQTIGTLPVDFRPEQQVILTVTYQNLSTRCDISTAGLVTIPTVATPTVGGYASLSEISFFV